MLETGLCARHISQWLLAAAVAIAAKVQGSANYAVLATQTTVATLLSAECSQSERESVVWVGKLQRFRPA